MGNMCVPVKINFDVLTFSAVTGAAFIDSINPCAIAVLLILLSALISVENKKKILSFGLSFVSALFITYFLLGIGIIGVIDVSGLAVLFHQIIGILAILIGLANIKDFICYGGGGFVMEIPLRWRPKIKKILGGVTSPSGAFLAGIIVTVFELPCTGGPYFFVLGLLSKDFSWTQIIPILLYYNFIFILPLLVLTVLIYLGFAKAEKVNAWKDRNLRILHLISGIIMIALGVWIIIN